MPFRSNRLRPVNSIKHVVDSQLTVPAGNSSPVVLVRGSENPVISTDTETVKVGAQVSSIFLNVQVVNSVDAVGLINNAYFYILLNPGDNLVAGSKPAVNEVGLSDNRKMIIHQEMVMLSDSNDSIPITMFKGVLKIPRKARRIGLNDVIELQVGTPTGGAEINACIQCIYKEYN